MNMKRPCVSAIVAATFAAFSTSGAYAQEMSYHVTTSYYDSVISISGSTEASDGAVTLEILKTDKTFDSNLTGNDLMDARQIAAQNGKYDFNVHFRSSNTTDGEHYVRLASSGGDEIEEFKIFVQSKEDLKNAYDELNSAAEQGITSFSNYINSHINELNFNFSLVSGDLSESDVKYYLNEVLFNPLTLNSAQDEIDNTKKFKTHVTASKVNSKELLNIDSVVSELYWDNDTFVNNYQDIIDSVNEQAEFTKKLANMQAHDVTSFDKAAKEALILTAVKSAGGINEIKEIFDTYGSDYGLKGNESNSVYRELIGKDFDTIDKLKSAYDSAAKESNKGSGNGKGSGGGSSQSSSLGSSISYDVNGTTQQSIPNQIEMVFEDLDGVLWASEAILALADKGIVNGIGEQRFAPDDNVTREQFVKILIGAIGVSAEYTPGIFDDVAGDDWFAPFVCTAYEKGVVKGIGNGKFGVGNNITREDMVTMLYQALSNAGVSMEVSRPSFDDFDSISGYAQDAVSALYNLGAVNGMTETAFEPKGLATRAQAAKVIYGILKLLGR